MFPPGDPPQLRESGATGRRRLLHRLLALLAAGSTAFALTTWTLVRHDDPLGLLGFEVSPGNVVKAQLEALNRGNLREAYEMFSRQYRQQVPFESFERLVTTHPRMFRTRELRVSTRQESGERAVLETHLLAESGERFRARFTLVRDRGRWWVDDLRWAPERDPKRRASLMLRAVTSLASADHVVDTAAPRA